MHQAVQDRIAGHREERIEAVGGQGAGGEIAQFPVVGAVEKRQQGRCPRRFGFPFRQQQPVEDGGKNGRGSLGAAEREQDVEVAGAVVGEIGGQGALEALLGGAAEQQRFVGERAIQGRGTGGIGAGAQIEHGGEEFRRVAGDLQSGFQRERAARDASGENGGAAAGGEIDGVVGGKARKQGQRGRFGRGQQFAKRARGGGGARSQFHGLIRRGQDEACEEPVPAGECEVPARLAQRQRGIAQPDCEHQALGEWRRLPGHCLRGAPARSFRGSPFRRARADQPPVAGSAGRPRDRRPAPLRNRGVAYDPVPVRRAGWRRPPASGQAGGEAAGA